MRIATLVIASAILASAFCQSAPAPALPYFDWGACPYEYCAYRQWTAHRSATLYDTWKQGRHPIAQINEGERATGLNGVVITRTPGKIRMDRNVPEANLHRGDILLTYADRGEGYSAVWFKGRYISDFDISFTKWPPSALKGCGGAHCAATSIEPGRKQWWAQVKLESGRTGWVDMGIDNSSTVALY